tara:strand:- start:22185 stop:22367 length:183 start_codon:yes stop_codon:yes gene_type:complete
MILFKVGDVVKLDPEIEGVLPNVFGVVHEVNDTITPVLVAWDIGYVGEYGHEDLIMGERV